MTVLINSSTINLLYFFHHFYHLNSPSLSVAAMTTQYAHYDMIKYGGYLTALSPFFLAMDTSIPAAVAMIVFLSFGEVHTHSIYQSTSLLILSNH